MKGIIERIQEDCPVYDPVASACARAGVTEELFKAAMSRVVLDGFYGPISSADWEEQDGRLPYTVREGLAILGTVAEEIDDYVEEDYFENEDGEEYLAEVGRVDAREIKREVFSDLVKIYGGLPF